MRERMLAGDLYLADDTVLAEEQARASRLLERFNRSGVDDVAERREVLVELLGHLGPGAEIKPPFRCDYGPRIRVGARTFVNYGSSRSTSHRSRSATMCRSVPTCSS